MGGPDRTGVFSFCGSPAGKLQNSYSIIYPPAPLKHGDGHWHVVLLTTLYAVCFFVFSTLWHWADPAGVFSFVLFGWQVSTHILTCIYCIYVPAFETHATMVIGTNDTSRCLFMPSSRARLPPEQQAGCRSEKIETGKPTWPASSARCHRPA